MRHLPTAGGGPAITAALGNNAQFTTQTGQATLQHIKSGKLRALASFGEQRSKSLPDVPTLKEKGIDVVYYLWVGLFAVKGTPDTVLRTLSAAIDQAGASAPFNAAIANVGLEPTYLNAAEFTKFWDADAKRSDDAVQQIGKVQGVMHTATVLLLPSPHERSEWRGGVGGGGRLRQTQNPRKHDGRIPRARAMRHEPTNAERVLWQRLRHLSIDGSHFRRQATIGPYFADFACHAARLVIEIDGGQHNRAARPRTRCKANGRTGTARLSRAALLEQRCVEQCRGCDGDHSGRGARRRPPTPDPSPPCFAWGEGS